jgi:hypothetical protein
MLKLVLICCERKTPLTGRKILANKFKQTGRFFVRVF